MVCTIVACMILYVRATRFCALTVPFLLLVLQNTEKEQRVRTWCASGLKISSLILANVVCTTMLLLAVRVVSLFLLLCGRLFLKQVK